MAEDTQTIDPGLQKGFSSFLAATGLPSGAEVEKKKTAIFERHKEERKPFIAQSEALMKQMTDLSSQVDRIQAPKALALTKLPEPPDTEYKDPTQALGGLASVLAMFGSLRTRAPLTSALNSAAASMQAFHQGDMERVKLERDKWHDNLEKGLRQNQQEMQEYTAALQASKFDIVKAQSAFRVIAAKNEHNQFLSAIEAGDYETQMHILDSGFKAGIEATKLYVTDQEKRAQIEATKLRAGLAKPASGAAASAAGVVPAEHADLHGPEYLATLPPGIAGTVKALSEGRETFASLGYRGADRQAMVQRVNQYNPTFQQGQQVAIASVIRDFKSGPQSKNIIAINQAISHMGTLDELGEALKNKDIRSINRFTNAIATEFGDPRINNFQLATQAVGDELMRTFRQVGADQTEAKAFQEKFQQAGSPEQIHGALETGAKLLHGRIKAVNNSWKRGMNVDTDYPNLIDPEPSLVLKRFGIDPLKEAIDAKSGAESAWTQSDEARLKELEAKHAPQ